MIKASWVTRLNNLEVYADQFFKTLSSFRENKNILATADYIGTFSTFTSATRTGAGTTTLIAPISGGSVIITDLIISGERQVASTTQVLFDDGTNQESLFLASAVDAPPSLNHTFRARVQGWRDARVDLTTTGTADATVMIGYVKVPTGLPFAEWDALR